MQLTRNPARSGVVGDGASYFEDARGYALTWEGDGPVAGFFRERRRIVLELLADRPPGRVLDIGCGPAVMTHALLERGFAYHGVDLSVPMIEEARSRFMDDPRVAFDVANIQALPFENESFDVVLCLGVLEYVPDLDRAIDEVVRVMRNNGVFVFSMLHRWSPYRVAEHVLHASDQPCRDFSLRDAGRLLVDHDLARKACVFYDFNLLPAPLDQRLPDLACALQRRLAFLARTPLRGAGTAFVVRAAPGNGS